jgi:hypothetical protein
LRRRLGLSSPAIILLAAIAAIRVPLHDLGIVPDGSVVAGLLVFVPLTVWLVVVLRRRVPNSLLALTAVGLAYGVMLAVIHQLLWVAAYAGNPPDLGGNLEGVLAPRRRDDRLSRLRLLQQPRNRYRPGRGGRSGGLGDKAPAARLTRCVRKAHP